MNKQTKQDKGFTLVELLIVIVILGILATVTVFAVRGITQDAEDNACATEQDVIETAIEAYNADQRQDATSVADLVGNDGYLKDNAAFRNQITLLPLPVATVAINATTGRWDITFSGDPDVGPIIEGVGDCAPTP